jgi:hypothetical protein
MSQRRHFCQITVVLHNTGIMPLPRNFVRQELERDETVQSRVLSFVDHAHAAAAQFLDDPVVRDGLADYAYRRNLGWPYVRALLLRKSKRYPVQGGLWVVGRPTGSN